MILNEAADRYNFNTPYIGIKQLKIPRGDIDPFNLDEVNLLLANVRADFRNYYLVRFFTGLRTAEIDGLQWKYVDFEKNLISIRETLVNGFFETTKTPESVRDIAMSKPVFDSQAIFSETYISPLYKSFSEHRFWFGNPTTRTILVAKRALKRWRLKIYFSITFASRRPARKTQIWEPIL